MKVYVRGRGPLRWGAIIQNKSVPKSPSRSRPTTSADIDLLSCILLPARPPSNPWETENPMPPTQIVVHQFIHSQSFTGKRQWLIKVSYTNRYWFFYFVFFPQCTNGPATQYIKNQDRNHGNDHV